MAEYAYKMFNADLTCTLGKGTYQYEPGKWYEEKEANCAQNGFHSAKNPLDCLNYYGSLTRGQMWLVEIDGDIDEDSCDTKVSSTRILLVKRLTLPEIVIHAMRYVYQHPKAPRNSQYVVEGPARVKENHFVISYGPNARAMGNAAGDVLGVIKTDEEGNVVNAAVYTVGESIMPNTWYGVNDLYESAT